MARAPSETVPIAAALVAVLFPLAGVAGRASAQEADPLPPRSGFWLAGGLGGGLDEDGEAGGAAFIRLGGTPDRHWLIGFEGIGYGRDADGVDATISRSNSTLVALYYPDVRGGWFLKGGVGFAHTEVERDVGEGTLTVSDDGLGLTLGTGLDFRIGGNLFLTPGFDVLLQTGDDFEGAQPLYLLTVGIGFH